MVLFRFMRSFGETAARLGVRLVETRTVTVTPDSMTVAEGAYRRMRIDARLQGSFWSLVQYVESIERNARPMVIENLVMTADRVLVFLVNTNQIKRIIALGNVVISQTDRQATCDKAVYEKGTEQVTLTGAPVLTRGADRVTGSEIVVFMNDQRVVVKNGRMVISPETMKNRDVKP